MERRNAMRDAMLPGRDPETANAFRRQLDALFARREPDAFMPPRNPETANAFRRQIDDLFAPRDPTREYGAILPISSDPNVPGSGQFDPKGGFIGELLGLLGAGSRAMRGEAYDPMAITSGLMNVAAPSVAARPSAGVLRSAGGSEPPRLPVEIKTAAETRLAPENTLRRSLQDFDAGILDPEQTARAARISSPEGLEYTARLQAQRDAWIQMDWRRQTIQDYTTKLQEPNLTDEGIFKIQQRIQRAQQRYAEALENAQKLGLDEKSPFPANVRLTAEIGKFPGDQKYLYRSYAPEGYPFNAGAHDFSDVKFRVPD